MRLTTKGRFAVTAMLDLAMHGGNGPVTLAGISRRQSISLSYLEQLFGKLRRHTLVDSVRGPGGGYTLARPPEDITLYDIMIATEGECLGLSGNFAGRSGRRLKQVWDDVRTTLVEKTKEYTLDQLASKNPTEMYYI